MANVTGDLPRGFDHDGISLGDNSATTTTEPDGMSTPQTTAGELTEFETRVRALLAQHAAVLLQEPLLPVWSTTATVSDSNHMLPAVVALDRAGRQVVVAVAYRLTPQRILDAIACAGNFGYLTRNQITEYFPGGPIAFDAAVSVFYAENPEGAARVAMPSTNARLVIVCGEVDPQSHGVMRFLHGSGGIVEVLPLTAQVVNRVVEQVRARMAAAQEMVHAAALREPVQKDAPSPEPDLAAVSEPAVVSLQEQDTPAPPVADVPEVKSDHSDASGESLSDEPAQASTEPSSHIRAVHNPTALSAIPPEPNTVSNRAAQGDALTTSSQPATMSQESTAVSEQAPDKLTVAEPVIGLHPRRRAEPLAITTEIPIVDSDKPKLPRTVLPRPAKSPVRPPARNLAVRTVALEAAVSGKSAEHLHQVKTQPTQQRDLRKLCAELESAVPLMWRYSANQPPHEATLHPDGTITTATGLRFTSPTRAAKAVSGTLAKIDGWNVWRIGERGPTLAEAYHELFE